MLASRKGLVDCEVELSVVERGSGERRFIYSLHGQEKSVSFRERELRSIAERDALSKRVELRLEAMFEEIWWRQALVLMRGGFG